MVWTERSWKGPRPAPRSSPAAVLPRLSMESAPSPTASCAPRPPDIPDYPDVFLDEEDVVVDPPVVDKPLVPIDVIPTPPLPIPPQIPVEPIVPLVGTVDEEKKPEESTEVTGNLEDEEALKPPSKDLPAFIFDDYESVRKHSFQV